MDKYSIRLLREPITEELVMEILTSKGFDNSHLTEIYHSTIPSVKKREFDHLYVTLLNEKGFVKAVPYGDLKRFVPTWRWYWHRFPTAKHWQRLAYVAAIVLGVLAIWNPLTDSGSKELTPRQRHQRERSETTVPRPDSLSAPKTGTDTARKTGPDTLKKGH